MHAPQAKMHCLSDLRMSTEELRHTSEEEELENCGDRSLVLEEEDYSSHPVDLSRFSPSYKTCWDSSSSSGSPRRIDSDSGSNQEKEEFAIVPSV